MIVKYTATEINRNFRIKFYGTTSKGVRVNTLVGVRGMLEELGEDLAEQLCELAFECPEDKYNRKLRRGLQVTFYAQ